tara:strand:+ start:16095 stop:16817 length:723 start_codon:yes stop_codon:yes gene_type:complete
MTQTFTLEIEGFRGPLELLLNLIERQKLQINDVSLAQVADDYIRHIEDRERVPLAQTAQFVVVAATLLLIKSKSLLPSIALTEEEEQDILDLERRLERYAHVRRASLILKNKWRKRSFLPRVAPQREIVFAPGSNISKEQIHHHIRALADVLYTFIQKPTAEIAHTLRLEDVIESLARRMRTRGSGSFARTVSGTDRMEAIVNFLALLELVKRGTLEVIQKDHFEDILMENEDIGMPRYD